MSVDLAAVETFAFPSWPAGTVSCSPICPGVSVWRRWTASPMPVSDAPALEVVDDPGSVSATACAVVPPPSSRPAESCISIRDSVASAVVEMICSCCESARAAGNVSAPFSQSTNESCSCPVKLIDPSGTCAKP